ncbi:hypothetical protein N5F07_12740 [Pseudomonas chengduensis]|nr:hypothetical protein [Pseudomonas chengduensis]MDH1622034.1 hypothetical protein [Pseudomonas chengduensis]MDH1868825.1 hypothetical protein [Pseudomonas chengduensis]
MEGNVTGVPGWIGCWKRSVVIRYSYGEGVWYVPGDWRLVDLEALLGRRIAIEEPIKLELVGRSLALCEWGLLMHLDHPVSGERIEVQNALWAFSDWLSSLESQGVARSHILGLSGVRALEWHAEYLKWAANEERNHARHLIESGEFSIRSVLEQLPRLVIDTEFSLWLIKYLSENDIPKIKRGRPQKLPPDHVQELAHFAFMCLQNGHSDDLSSACRDVCNARPDWLPAYWSASDDPGRLLYDAIRVAQRFDAWRTTYPYVEAVQGGKGSTKRKRSGKKSE